MLPRISSQRYLFSATRIPSTLTRVTVHGQRTALCHLDRMRVLLSCPSWLCGNGEHCEKVPGSDISKLVAVPPWLQKAPLGGVCTSSEVEIPPHRTFASLGFVHLAGLHCCYLDTALPRRPQQSDAVMLKRCHSAVGESIHLSIVTDFAQFLEIHYRSSITMFSFSLYVYSLF